MSIPAGQKMTMAAVDISVYGMAKNKAQLITS